MKQIVMLSKEYFLFNCVQGVIRSLHNIIDYWCFTLYKYYHQYFSHRDPPPPLYKFAWVIAFVN
jgi:hypothetical protein